MDTLTFLAKMTEALAWPLVTLVLGLVFRRKLLDLIPAIRKLKAGPVEAEFELATKQVLSSATEVTSHAALPGADTSARPEARGKSDDSRVVTRLLNARTDPAGTILDAWGTVDDELFRLGVQMDLIVPDPLTNTKKVYESVMASDVLPAETRRLVRELRDLYNKVAHGHVVPTPDAAQDYVAAVARVDELIHNYRKNLPNYGSISR
jgi:hypothetical protein